MLVCIVTKLIYMHASMQAHLQNRQTKPTSNLTVQVAVSGVHCSEPSPRAHKYRTATSSYIHGTTTTIQTLQSAYAGGINTSAHPHTLSHSNKQFFSPGFYAAFSPFPSPLSPFPSFLFSPFSRCCICACMHAGSSVRCDWSLFGISPAPNILIANVMQKLCLCRSSLEQQEKFVPWRLWRFCRGSNWPAYALILACHSSR